MDLAADDPIAAIVAALHDLPAVTADRTADLPHILLVATGRPPITVPPLIQTQSAAILKAALSAIGAVEAEEDPALPPSPRERLAWVMTRLAELEEETLRLRAEADELRLRTEPDEVRPVEPSAGEEAPDEPFAASPQEGIVEETTAGRVFRTIFRRSDPARPAREYQGPVELAVRSPAEPEAVWELERALRALPGVTIRLVWGEPQRGTTIGLDIRTPLALSVVLRSLPIVQDVQELGERGGIGRLRLRLVG
ncbi:MAG: hypothetical protein U0556_02750 [Dehalococcoidia bacterium]